MEEEEHYETTDKTVDICVGDDRYFRRVPLSILVSQPGSMLWRAVELHLNEQTDEVLRFPTASGEYFQYILDILAGKCEWWKLKTRENLFHFMVQMDYFHITGTASLLEAHRDAKQEYKRQQEQYQRETHSLRLAADFLPYSVFFREIPLFFTSLLGHYGLPLYRYELDLEKSDYQRELNQIFASEVIYDLHILTGREDPLSIPVPWPTVPLDIDINWLDTLRPCQYSVMKLATKIRADYPTVKVSLYIHVDRVYIRVQPRNGIELEPGFQACCMQYGFVLMEKTCHYVHKTTCLAS
jgi:hypothetical protein